MNAIIKTDAPIYLLLGYDASNTYMKEGFDKLLEVIKKEEDIYSGFDFQLGLITDGMDLFNVMDGFDGYFGYTIIEEGEYNILNDLINKLV